MSRNGSQPEYILKVALKELNILSKFLGYNLTDIKLEKSMKSASKKVIIDLFATEMDKRFGIYVEVQCKRSDIGHWENSILPILQSIDQGIVVWIAKDFTDIFKEMATSFLKRNPRKKIHFIGLRINDEVLKCLNVLNSMYTLEIWGNLSTISQIQNPLTLAFEYMPIEPIAALINDVGVDSRESINPMLEYLLNELRLRIPYFMTLHREKVFYPHKRSLDIGAGSSLTYECSLRDSRGRAYVLIRGTDENSIFDDLVTKLDEFKNSIHPNLSLLRKNEMGVVFKPFPETEQTIDAIAEILERMIVTFSPYTFKR